MKIIRDASLDGDGRRIGIVDVRYPEPDDWDVEGFERYKEEVLAAVRAAGSTYDRETVFRQDPYFRYFRKFKKSYPVMMQVESYLLKGRPFPDGAYINAVAFLTELRNHILLGTHDYDCVEGDIVFYNESAKTPFTGMINPDCHSYPNDITGRDDKGIIISMIAGADDRTCIHEDTRHVLYLIFGLPDMLPYSVAAAGAVSNSEISASDAFSGSAASGSTDPDCIDQITKVADQIREAALRLAPTAEISFAIY